MPTPAAMRQLWLRMVAIYGAKWASVHGAAAETDAGKLTETANTWVRGLAGVTGEQLGAGLKACVSSSDPWPPTLSEFRARCMGIPSFAAVQLILGDKTRPMTPFVRQVWSYVDAYRFRAATSDKAEKILRDAYELAREHVINGGALPEPVAGALEQDKPEFKAAPPEVAERHIAELSEFLRRRAAQVQQERATNLSPDPPEAA
ncbi:hypothetical protein [Luteibacter anthropi]|uniref:Replication protein P n=1 Tax=Luteibacter anthropi TaxID=564369 RepID=A0A7X5ZJ05_9GAMM|nr:hypothetical protein [Luteibacter anthropi]NII07235.1 hypothetical protein [Luteibacter anthropi]